MKLARICKGPEVVKARCMRIDIPPKAWKRALAPFKGLAADAADLSTWFNMDQYEGTFRGGGRGAENQSFLRPWDVKK